MRLCVFCGTSLGTSPHYAQHAAQAGRTLARAGIGLVYGGGKVGLMGVIADAVLSEGGEVVGVITQSLVEREIAHAGLTTLHIVKSMHERKLKMGELADGFLALPGGPGTWEEFFEQWTWAQLGIHRKPCGLLNTNGYFNLIREMIHLTISEGFLDQRYGSMLLIEEDMSLLLERISSYSPPRPKWSSTIDMLVDQ